MITVTQKGLRVDYTNNEGQSSSIRVTEDVGALFAAAPDLLKVCEEFKDAMKRAYGFGDDKLDTNAMECPELAISYNNACAVLSSLRKANKPTHESDRS